jgi:hypothetical protein
MTKEKSFKRRVRERMSKTGESYTAARSHVTQKRARVEAARTKLAAAPMPVSEEKLKEATGRRWEAWFSILDRWGARDRKHGEMVGFLMDEHDVEGWYAQAITVGYERARGMRLKHQQADGFTVYASKTIAAWPHGTLRLGGRLDASDRLVRQEGLVEVDRCSRARAATGCRRGRNDEGLMEAAARRPQGFPGVVTA